MWQQALDNLIFLFTQLRVLDLFDILLVWLVVYRILVLIKRTGTIQMLSGLGILAIGYILSIWLEFFTLNWILEKFFSNLFVIVVILFQAEIRRALAQIGFNPFLTGVTTAHESQIIEEIIRGVMMTAEQGHGGLVVIEKEILIDYHVEIGTELEAKVSAELISSIFHPSSPMHDGAIIIRQGKIQSAGSFLPLSKNPVLDKNLGTRHRAALGLTEETDAVVIVISEENKSVGWVQSGQLHTKTQASELRKMLYDAFGLKYRAVLIGESTS